MVNVLRFGGGTDLSQLVDRAEAIEVPEIKPAEAAKEEEHALIK
jgi:hypothetical protein